jgi:hypothetical protein
MTSDGISPRPDFDRRLRPNKTIDSVCLHCLRSVGSRLSQDSLGEIELSHWCWQKQAKLARERKRATNITT